MAVMTAAELAEKCKEVALEHKTLYVMGCFGAPLTGSSVNRYCNNHSYNKKAARTKAIKAAGDQSPPVYGFDCVGLIKGLLWGWEGNASKLYGGSGYAANGVPDIGADQMIRACKDVSTDFSRVQIGEVVWTSGHIGVYIGGGLAVECTPKWADGVQITAVSNVGKKAGYNARTWTRHGKLPYVDYSVESVENTAPEKTVDEVAREVIAGMWGNGPARRKALTAAGYDYAEVQKGVNAILSGSKTPAPEKTVDEVAREVIAGMWGNGSARRKALTAAGYDYAEVQNHVNDLLTK